MAQLDKQTYLNHLRTEGDLLLATFQQGGATAMVPNCPEWSVGDLVVHTAQVWGYMAETVANPSTDPPGHGFPKAPEEMSQIGSWAEGQLNNLIAQLEPLDISQPMWNFGTDPTAAFFPRRMAHETAIHRWDAQAANGGGDPLDSELAADGVDEFLEVSLPRQIKGKEATDLPGGSLHLHRTDGPGEWMLHIVDGSLVVTQEHGKGDAAVRGGASDLDLFCWGRGQGSSIEVFGDEAVVAAYGAILA